MNTHSCQALVITCIDFRLQEYINEWIKGNFSPGTYDRVALAGGVKNLAAILDQIDISVKLHHIKKVVLINHEDCGAYGEEGHIDRHVEDLQTAGKQIKEKIPDLEVETYYLKLNGAFEKIQ